MLNRLSSYGRPSIPAIRRLAPLPRLRFISTMPSPPTLENIAIDIDSQAIAVIKYNRPKAANALNTPVLKDFLSALRWADSEDAIRIIITTGEGKFYTAGLDLLDPINQQPGATISDDFSDTLRSVSFVGLTCSLE